MKIVFFTYLMLEYGGGLATYLIDVTTGLKKRYPDLDITIITFNEQAKKKIIALYSLYFFGKQDTYTKHKETTTQVKDVLQGVKYEKVSGLRELKQKLATCDTIYTSNNLLELCLLKLMGFPQKKTKVIAGFHVPIHYPITPSLQSKFHNLMYASSLYYFLLNKVAKFHVINSFDERLLKKHYGSKVVKIYNPFDFDSFVNLRTSKKVKIQNGRKFSILWTGRLTEQKGVHELAEIMSAVNKTHEKSIIWKIIGDGELKGVILASQKQWKNIRYLGYISHQEIASQYKSSDLFISTSTWESFPYNLLEAQSFGMPVICYNIHGCNDIIISNKNGYLVRTKQEFTQKIMNEITTRKLKKNDIKKFIRTKFDQKQLYQNLYSLLTN